MKSLKIEYEGHKLKMLVIDGMQIKRASGLSLSHTCGGIPELTLVLPVAGNGESIIPLDDKATAEPLESLSAK